MHFLCKAACRWKFDPIPRAAPWADLLGPLAARSDLPLSFLDKVLQLASTRPTKFVFINVIDAQEGRGTKA